MDALRSEKELLRSRERYGRGGRCVVCGKPTDSLSIKCVVCIGKAFVADAVASAGSWLKEQPRLPIWLAHDRRKIIHLVLFRASASHLGWCGARVTQRKSTRAMTRSDLLTMPGVPPKWLCGWCMQAFKQATS